LKKVAFTTSIPVEVVFAAGMIPVDLNNVFITGKNPERDIERAESAGFPRNTCTWIKGIYSSMLDSRDIDVLIGVVEGDCSNTKALLEVLRSNGIKSIPFSYPNSRNYCQLKGEINKLCSEFGATEEACIKVKEDLDKIREKLVYLDELTWKHNKATGFENHIWQVSSSDFNGDYNSFEKELTKSLTQIEQRKAENNKIRLGYIGVPPIFGDLYHAVEKAGARVVFNEVQRQFTMADSIGINDLVEVYRRFTYPYNIDIRLEDIKRQIELRELDGIIHYTQSFCFRGIEDIVIRKELNIPVLTLEGDRPGNLDARTRLRLEAFIDMLK
jgi:benzoyl-CoA reductase/2-hydroxyglutaryl-CoA dehydratase subunit BcrC/BadD/HgdB